MKTRNRINVFVISRIALMAAVTALLAQMSVPMPSGVSITLQTFAVALCGYLLGAGAGSAAIAVYLSIGAVGLPVFAGLRGGIAVLAGPSGGFLWGFLAMAALCGAKTHGRLPWKLASGFLGLALCHVVGVAQYALVARVSFAASFVAVSAPYLIKDIVSVILALACASALHRRLSTR